MSYGIKRAYITGVTGTIGMALLNELIEDGTTVEVFVRETSPRTAFVTEYKDSLPEDAAKRLIINYVSLAELSSYCKVSADSEGPVVFYHLAWEGTVGAGRNDVDLQEQNVIHSVDAVELAARLGCTAFVGAGSQAEYGRVSGVIDENTPLNPEMEYGKAKAKASVATRNRADALGLNHTWVRILSVYGPYNDSNTMIMSLIDSLLSGKEAKLTKGEQVWDYLYCKDVAKALALIGTAGAAANGQIYCLGSGKGKPLHDYIYDICYECGASKELLKFGEIPYGERQIMYLVCDITKAQNELGFMPSTDFREGIRETVKWIQKRRKK